jgi:hypothetical protein
VIIEDKEACLMQMIFTSFVLPQELKKAWKKAARADYVSAAEFLRRCLRDGVNKTAALKAEEPRNQADAENRE